MEERLQELRAQLQISLSNVVERDASYSVRGSQTARDDPGVGHLFYRALPALKTARECYDEETAANAEDDDDTAEKLSQEDLWRHRCNIRAAAQVGPRVRANARYEHKSNRKSMQDVLRHLDDEDAIRREKQRYELAVRKASNKRATIDTGLYGNRRDVVSEFEASVDVMIGATSQGSTSTKAGIGRAGRVTRGWRKKRKK